ncbi:MAG: hypothetical protein FJ164_03360 [Gammaproteobacteria bacterium]|nr:hypothetical protein [Gammaproteobacteria bacterium]
MRSSVFLPGLLALSAAPFVLANGPLDGTARGTTAGQCPEASAEQPLETRTGSAGILYNLAEHPKSIRAVAAKLLSDALDGGEKVDGAACGSGCTASASPEVVYRVAPKMFLPKAEQAPLCLTLEADTTKAPLSFPPQEFKSVEALNAWVMEFSQGRGDLGKQLYERCGGNCSPRYEFHIAQGAGGLNVETSVICGLARDTASDEYEVSTAVRRRCALPADAD